MKTDVFELTQDKQELENMKKSIEDFAGDTEQFDDMTMLAIRYYGVK